MKSFEEVNTCKELIYLIRQRYQMWVEERVCSLYGFICGFSVARSELDFGHVREFSAFVANNFADSKEAISLVRHIENHASSKISEIPLFFELYEQFLGIVPLEQEFFFIEESDRILCDKEKFESGSPVYVPSPHYLTLVELESWGTFLFFLNEHHKRYYELCVESKEYGERFAVRSFSAKSNRTPDKNKVLPVLMGEVADMQR
ncbi:hypothetical protein [Methylovulum psychrotolerans]|uniref:Uncharacterized protein n=1 Tax=Methylovulum psychrotolerans TaxID=1704499 RepID=A0A1Z4BUV4_9GAMM|nr:hypothetical protein [Methylovulum psychrotolerans]ASF45096.1 hypothetical protein CEK71_02895 [Methylovulum psychrotolerans]